ncbi:hypothetical protein [Nocardioides sp.]|uniref:hypothetical protein n=1 Tax=Nocardioides sp. TaxID=35761 RepID=UPI002ECFE887
MTTPPEQDRPETAAERRARLARVFGDVLPETTQDERDPGVRRDDDSDPGDEWLRSQVPPHHGG